MATFNTIGLEEPSSVTKELAAVTVQRNSSNTEQELITLADPESSLGLLRITDTTPDSTMFGAVVRQVGYTAPSTTVNVSSVAGAVIIRSSAANALVSVYQSTATDLLARVNQGVGNSSAADRWRVNAANSSAGDYTPVRLVDSSGTGFLTPGNEYTAGSTYSSHAGPTISFDNSSNNTYRTVGVNTPLPAQIRSSSGGDPFDSTNRAINVNVVAGAAGGSTVVTVSTGSVRVHQSTAADLVATVRLNTSSGGALEGSTSRPAAGVIGLHVRPVFPALASTTVVITSSNSTATYALVSSAAALKQKVFAYAITSTVTSPSTLVFCSVGSSDNTTADRWAIALGSGSSGITGANLAVSPPAWLFESITADAVKCRIENGGSTQTIARVALSYFPEA